MGKLAPGLNLNTVLLAIVLGIAGWTLRTVVEIGNTMAATVARVDQQERDNNDIKARLGTVEHDMMRNAHYSPAPTRPNA